ncbi:MAG: FKBP-type peptidyl-prolyl cis-trans isomerase [Lachnospiraceae bacterium]|nr:FKBP-type peptidyl-prolyl cis-trans isomerase [Lachnospiraceae bacterium]
MRIAVTYENGNIFQHFGHTEEFKIYKVEDGKVVSAEVIGSDGSGHSALAGFLNDKGIDVLICGGIGGGAQAALQERGIELCAGAAGDADAAVAAYLRGELVNTGANCDHHGEGHHCGDDGDNCHCGDKEEGCRGGDEEGCGDDGDEGCAFGCCGGTRLKGKNVGKKVSVHYRGTFNDGTQFDSSYDRNAPLEFICGAGQMIAGFDAAVANMEVGQAVDIHLMPAEAYGEKDPAAFFTVGLAQLPGAEELTVGEQVYLQDQFGRPFRVRVAAKDQMTITFDANHEMAGKELNFHIELLEVED